MEGATESVKRRKRSLDDIDVDEGRGEPSRKTEEGMNTEERS